MAILIIKDIFLAHWLVLLPLLLLILVAGQWIWYQRKNRQLLELANKLPCPTRINTFFGNSFRTKANIDYPALTREDVTHTAIKCMRAAAEKPYSLFCMWFGLVPYIGVQKPHDVKIFLTSSKTLDKGPDAKAIKFSFGDGLVTAASMKWKISRRYMNPIFHHENLNNLTDVFNQVSRQVVNDLACHVGEEPFDVFSPLLTVTVNSVSSLLFGLQIQRKMKIDDFKRGASYIERLGLYTGERTFSPWLWSDRAFNLIFKKKLEDLEETWTQFKSQAFEVNEHEDFLTIPKVYSNILQEHNIFSKANMDEEMKTIMAAGSDTSAHGLSCCLMLLGTHPNIQEKLYTEIVGLLGSEDQDVTIQDINNLPYLDQVIKESLRISTVVALFQRSVSEELKLSEYTIPKGANVVVSVIGLHFDPEVYPDPYVFNPEHFTPENVAKRHPYSYLPFGGGPRNCIGKQYAMTSMKIMLTYLLRAYKISASKNILDLRYVYQITLSSIEGYKITVERRTK